MTRKKDYYAVARLAVIAERNGYWRDACNYWKAAQDLSFNPDNYLYCRNRFLFCEKKMHILMDIKVAQ